jgi:hypothetical protein
MGAGKRAQQSRITLKDLIEATGTSERDLIELRRRGLFPFKIEHTHIPGRRGSASFFPREAVAFLNHLAELRQKRRDVDEWIWQLWLHPADYEIDMRKWVLQRLTWRLETIEAVKAAGRPINRAAEAAILRKFHIASHVRNPKARRLLMDWVIAWFFDEERPDIYGATPEGTKEPSYFDLALKSLGFPRNAPIHKGKISDRGAPYWLARFQRIVSLAQDREITQARKDWRIIEGLAKLAENADWNQVPPLAIPGKSEPPSWTTRKARRSRPRPPPGLIQVGLLIWRSFDGRALAFCVFLIARRLFSRSPMPQIPDEWAGIARQWLEGVPKVHSATTNI